MSRHEGKLARLPDPSNVGRQRCIVKFRVNTRHISERDLMHSSDSHYLSAIALAVILAATVKHSVEVGDQSLCNSIGRTVKLLRICRVWMRVAHRISPIEIPVKLLPTKTATNRTIFDRTLESILISSD